MADDKRPLVGLSKHDDEGEGESLRRAIELCDGFAELDPHMRVVIKPNLVWSGGSRHMPRFGVLTTTRMVEDMIVLLKDRGCADITLAEGSVHAPEMKSSTAECAKWLGLDRVCEDHGVPIVDLNFDETETVEIDGVKARIAKTAKHAEFLINMPVLKTHCQTKVSLGMKNLKGCLPMVTKRAFHNGDLEKRIALLSSHITSHLTVLDGIYTLESGPVATIGLAHRLNMVAASTDVLAADMTGAALLGFAPADVPYIAAYAEDRGRPCGMDAVEVAGENVADNALKLEWRLDMNEYFRRSNIDGISMQEPGKRWCSGCALNAGAALFAYTKDHPNRTHDAIELCFGPEAVAGDDSKDVLLCGKCAMQANKDRAGAIKVKGCPPTAGDIMIALMARTIPWHKRVRTLVARGLKNVAFNAGLHDERFGLFHTYEAPEFDPAHFAPRRR